MPDEVKDITAANADAKQGDALPPAPPKLEFTTAEFEAKVADEVAKATAKHQETVAELNTKLKQAQSLTDDEKRVATLKESYVIGHKMPEELAEVFASIADPVKRDKAIATWKANVPTVNAEALESANKKLKGSFANEKVISLGQGGGAPRGISDKEYIQKSADGEIPFDAKRTKAILDGMGVKL